MSAAGIVTSAPTAAPDTASSIGRLDGTVLEIGPGTGVNLRHYGRDVEWIGVEPDRGQHQALRREAARLGLSARVTAAVAEEIPLPTSSVDAVVGTLVLCSVADVARSLSEVRRVLRPGGVYLFDEHVAAPRGTWLRRGQALWGRLDPGECRPDRETWTDLEAAGFRHLDIRRYQLPGPLGVALPYIAGEASA